MIIYWITSFSPHASCDWFQPPKDHQEWPEISDRYMDSRMTKHPCLDQSYPCCLFSITAYTLIQYLDYFFILF